MSKARLIYLAVTAGLLAVHATPYLRHGFGPLGMSDGDLFT